MKRNKIILIVALAVAVLACGFVGWLLIKAIIDKNTAEGQRNSDFSELHKIYSSQVFPNTENIERVKADQKELEKWLTSIAEQLHKGDLPEDKLTPATFKQNLQATVRELSRWPGINNGKAVTPDFHFGFDRYLGESNELPEIDDVPRLSVQLRMIERVSKELFDARILSLDKITREVFDAATSASAGVVQQRATSRRRRRPRADQKQSSSSQPEMGADQVEIPEGLVTKERFTFEFTATPEAFVAALNKLAAMDLFVVVSESTFVKTGDQLEKMAQKPKTGVDSTPEKKLSEKDHYERTITNPVSDLPVSVKLVLDVYSFKGL